MIDHLLQFNFDNFFSICSLIQQKYNFKAVPLTNHVETLQFDNPLSFFSDTTSNFNTNSLEDIPEKTCSVPTYTNKTNLWLASYDKTLGELTKKYKFDWKKIARRMQSISGLRKSVGFLKARMKVVSSQNKDIKFKRFTKDEDGKLRNIIEEHGFNRQLLMKEFPNRDMKSIRNRFYYMMRS